MKKEIKKEEDLEMEEVLENVEEVKETGLVIKNFNEMEHVASKSKVSMFTTIEDPKTLFNLQNECDYKINDCKGEIIRVKDVLIKVIETPLAEPEVNEETGEVHDKEYKKICILIDDAGKSYVTGSKMFTNQMMSCIELFGIPVIQKGLEIKIVEKSIKGSNNKSLGFELV